MIRKTVFFISLIIISFACNKPINKDGSCTNIEEAEIIVHDGVERQYILYVPNSYTGNDALPVMFNFHGFGGNALDYMNEADMRDLADTESFILVYPQGTCLDGFPHWNAALDSPENKSDADDMGFIDALISELDNNYNIDLERLYACGYSNGAFFSYAMACYLSDRIAAIGSVSGTMLDISSTCAPQHPTAMINIHGTNDDVIPYDGSSEYNGIEPVINYWINFNSTDTSPLFESVTDNGRTIEQYQYLNGDSGVVVDHYKIIGGEHVWFDLNFNGNNTDDLIWNFVSQYDINGLR